MLDLPPEALEFGREARGRPFLRHAKAPEFNLSDTPGGSLLAIAARGRPGVDVERLDRALPVERLARRWFSAAECAALQALPAEAGRAAFLRLWTAKEASCKATGTGIFGYLAQWSFCVEAQTPVLQCLPPDAGDAERWQFERLQPSAEHTAVVAVYDAPGLVLSGFQTRASAAAA
ncbi:MAG: 4'-phosphopantetheinyl transferase superfamily protein [Arenimonas sp.]